MGLTSALALAGRSLEIFSAGIQVAGDNIANANTPGYVRENLGLATASPNREGELIFGNGVVTTGIRQQIDTFLETRIHSANSDLSGANVRNNIYKQLENTLQSLSSGSLSSQLGGFLSSVQTLVNQPESVSNRQQVVQQGQQFAGSINALRTRIDDIRTASNAQVSNLVTEANNLIDQINTLNPQITALESAGLLKSDAGSVRVQRYQALTRLAQILPITTVDHSTGGIDVFLGNEHLVLSGDVQHLGTVATVDRGASIINVVVGAAHTPLAGTRGELNGTINGRDQILGGFIDQLDQFTSNAINEFNKVYASGQGLHGYGSVKGTYEATNVNASLNAAGLPFTPVNGGFQVQVTNKLTGSTQTTDVRVDLTGTGTDTTLTSLVGQLGGVANISAAISPDRKLSLTASTGYEIRFANDTSGALAALGVNTFFTGSGSRDIAVNATVAADPSLFAAAQGGGPGDGTNAVALAKVADQPVASLGNVSVRQFYDNTISAVAQSSSSQAALADGYKGFLDSLNSQRSQYSGVSLDEEALRIIQYQHNYQASAKLISTIDQLFTALLQI